MHNSLLHTLLALVLVTTVASMRQQWLKAKGRLVCPLDPQKASGITVKLLDEDEGPDPDDIMQITTTDSQGNFVLEGSTSELTNIDGRLKIYHHCNQGVAARCLQPCYRRVKVSIPDQYISTKPNPSKVFDLGQYNLEMIQTGEECHCTPV